MRHLIRAIRVGPDELARKTAGCLPPAVKMSTFRSNGGTDQPMPDKKLFVPNKRIYPYLAKLLYWHRFIENPVSAPFLLRARAADKETTGATVNFMVWAGFVPAL